MTRKKIEDIKEIESEELEEVVIESIEIGTLGEGGDFFELRLDETLAPMNKYDFVVYIPDHNPGYPLGTAAARAYSALKEGGKFIIDFSGNVYNPENIKAQIAFSSFEFSEEKDGKMVFEK